MYLRGLRGVENIKTTEYGYVRLYGYRPKSVTLGLGCGQGCTLALSVMTALLRQQMRQLWSYTNEKKYLKTTFLKTANSGSQIS